MDSIASRIKKLQAQRSEIRDRHLGASSSARPSLPNLLKPLHREMTPQADELCRYGQLWIQETAMVIRAEMLAGLLAKGRQLEEGLCRLRRSIEAVGRLFLVNDPAFRNSESVSLGRSVEFFPGGTVGLSELRDHTHRFVLQRTATCQH